MERVREKRSNNYNNNNKMMKNNNKYKNDSKADHKTEGATTKIKTGTSRAKVAKTKEKNHREIITLIPRY